MEIKKSTMELFLEYCWKMDNMKKDHGTYIVCSKELADILKTVQNKKLNV